jgi:hypothetical protein
MVPGGDAHACNSGSNDEHEVLLADMQTPASVAKVSEDPLTLCSLTFISMHVEHKQI